MGHGVREIKIKLWRHGEDDWSIEVHGRLHSRMSSVMVDELVEYALVAAQQALELEQSPVCHRSLLLTVKFNRLQRASAQKASGGPDASQPERPGLGRLQQLSHRL
jgi:hypothetical protein